MKLVKEWLEKTNDIIGDGFVLALVQKIEDLQNDVENLKYNIVDFNGVCY